MKVEVVLDAACTEPELTLRTAAVTGEVEQLLRRLSEQPPLLCGERAGRLEVLDPDALVRVYAAAGRVYAVTERANICCGCGCTRRKPGWRGGASCASPTRSW